VKINGKKIIIMGDYLIVTASCVIFEGKNCFVPEVYQFPVVDRIYLLVRSNHIGAVMEMVSAGFPE
jgi:hypothetical protein